MKEYPKAVGIKYFKNSNAFTEFSSNINDLHRNIVANECKLTNQHKIETLFKVNELFFHGKE